MSTTRFSADGNKLIVEKVFDATIELVFDSFIDPEIVKFWLTGPDDKSMYTCEIDARQGGYFRYVWSMADGSFVGMKGEFIQLIAPEKIVHTELFDEDWTGGKTLNTSTFEESNGKTLYRLVTSFSSEEALIEARKTGMEEWMAPSYDRLETLLTQKKN